MTADVRRASRGHGLRGLIVAAAAAALVLGARGQVARAAPPALTASENPVVIAAPATTKAITLNYDLGGMLSKAMLTVAEAGGPQLVTMPVASQSGSAPLTVTYGKAYNAQVIDLSTNTAAATLQITTKRPDAQNPGGQALATSSNIIRHGTYAEVAMTANQPAMFAVTASTGMPDGNGNFAKIESSAITFVPQTSWTGMLANLKPNTTYYYVITAKNVGNTSTTYEQSSFKTLARRVDVTFEQVHVTDDSDWSAHCECTFFFKAGDAPTKQYGEVKLYSGATTWETPLAQVTVNNAPDNLTLRVSGFDNDDDGPIPTCGLPSDVVSDNGSNTCWDWSSASKTLDVAVDGFGEAFSGTFSIVAHGGPLKFEVSGSFKVSYV